MEQEKLYSPLEFFLRDKYEAAEGQYDDVHYWRDELSHEEAFQYMAEIKAALADDRQRYDNGRGLAEYLDEGPLNNKVQSLAPHIELHVDKLWTVAHLQLNEPLTAMEMAELKFWWEGQLSDGWGEGFEQREIKVDRGDLYVKPWTAANSFRIFTQEQFDRRIRSEHTQQEEQHPGPHPDERTRSKETELFSRLDKNLSDYCESLLDTDKRELIGMAEDIATWFGVRDYLTRTHHWKEPELNFLLGFQDPLEVVCEHTPDISTLLNMSGAISELTNLDGSLRREFTPIQGYDEILATVDARDAQLTQVAHKHCHVETLETRNRDSLDFHEVSVWGLKAALQEAFEAGAAHQMAKVSAVEIPEPEAAPVVDEQALRDTLEARLEENLADMMNDLRSDISDPHLPTDEVVRLADRITAVSAAYEYLTESTLPLAQVEYLLNFQTPLEVVADSWPSTLDGLIDMEDIMWDICDRQDALQGDYPLISAGSIPPAVREEPATPASGKPSLLAGLREAQARAAAENSHTKDKPTPKHTGPEL